MAYTKLSIIQLTYNLLGQIGPTDLTTIARDVQVSAIYDMVLKTVLAARPWSFALTVSNLSALGSPQSISDYPYGYALPSGYFAIYRTDPLTDFMIYDDGLYTPSEFTTLQLQYTADPGETYYPDHFVNFLTAFLASKIAMLITQDINTKLVWEKNANLYYIQSKNIDSKNQPNKEILSQPVYLAHQSAGSSYVTWSV